MAQSSLSLYEIEQDLVALLDTVDLVESEDQHLAILDDIHQTHEAALAKRDSVIHFLLTVAHRIKDADTEIERLSRLRDSWKLGKARLEAYLVRVIDQFVPEPRRKGEVKKLEGRFGVLSIAKNRDSVDILDGSLVPAEFKDVTIKLSGTEYETLLSRLENAGLFEEGVLLANNSQSTARKVDIKKAMDGGVDVAGADVRFGGSRLSIR